MNADQILIAMAAALMSYLIGALPFSLWIAKWRGIDIQKAGSGNPGATNVARSVGKEWGAIALVLDIGKGIVPGLLVAVINAPLALAAFAVLGHNWSVFLKFKGGKGVATTLGVLIAVNWLAALWTVAVWLGLVVLTRKVSVGSITAMLVSPVVLWLLQADWTLTFTFAALGVLSAIRHRENIQRLLKGEENTLSKDTASVEESSSDAAETSSEN